MTGGNHRRMMPRASEPAGLAPDQSTAATTPPRDFPFLDGIRAAAALFVALFHAFLFSGHSGETQAAMPGVGKIFLRLNVGVTIFIVLSGFVLMPSSLRLSRSLGHYLMRRSRRILPPYYAAMAIFLVMIAAVPQMRHVGGTEWDSKIPVTAGAVVSHLLMIHNLNPDSAFKIDGPMWSVATEYQIYFAMPLLILPLWRRTGPAITLTATTVAAIAIHYALPRLPGHLWLVAVFAFGMYARYLVDRQALPTWWRNATIVSLVVGAVAMATLWNRPWFAELVVGAAVAMLVAYLANTYAHGRPNPLLTFFGSRIMLKLGLFSYSIYLIHSPILGLLNRQTIGWSIPIEARLALMILVAVPICVTVSYVFHLGVEKRFLTTHQKRVERETAPG